MMNGILLVLGAVLVMCALACNPMPTFIASDSPSQNPPLGGHPSLNAPRILFETINGKEYRGSENGGIIDVLKWLDGQTQGTGNYAAGSSGEWGGQSWKLDGTAARDKLQGRSFTIRLDSNESIGPQALGESTYGSYTNIKGTDGKGKAVSITLTTDGTARHLTLNAQGALFWLIDGAYINLTLEGNAAGILTLRGISANNYAIIENGDENTLTMNTGVTLTGNENVSGGSGGGVFNSGIFTMNGGEISGNKVSGSGYSAGGGVATDGTFTMTGGKISNNTVTEDGYSGGGGGVYIVGGAFTMTGGEISGNIAEGSRGGGVYIEAGQFMMKDSAKISGNSATTNDSSGQGGNGGGVFIQMAYFTMYNGEISGNHAKPDSLGNENGGNGGGVYNESGVFYMINGEIKGNDARLGGGLYLRSGDPSRVSPRFNMNDGFIYGRDADSSLANKAITWAKAGSASAAVAIDDAFKTYTGGRHGAYATTDALFILGTNDDSQINPDFASMLATATWGNGFAGQAILSYSQYDPSPYFFKYSENGDPGGSALPLGWGWGYGGTIKGGSPSTYHLYNHQDPYTVP
jgi:hypothetical protein